MNKGHFAVVVGINRYPGIGDLTRAKDDARDFRAWLIDENGGRVPPENVETVIVDDDEDAGYSNPLESHPTLHEIDSALRTVNIAVGKAVQEDGVAWKDTRLYFYASGHGITPHGGAGALLLANSARSAYDMTLENMEIQSYVTWYESAAYFHELLVFADCCREHRQFTPGGGPPFDKPMSTNGMTVWLIGFATEVGNYAYEPTKGDGLRGYFTKGLMDGLRGGAADLETGEITTETLTRYVTRSVAWQVEGKPFVQRPMLAGVFTPMVLRPAELGPLPREQRKMALHIRDEAPRDLVLFQRGKPTGHVLQPGNGTIVLTLPEDHYQVRGPDGAELEMLTDKGQFEVIAEGRDVRL